MPFLCAGLPYWRTRWKKNWWSFSSGMHEICAHNRLRVSLLHLLIRPRNMHSFCWDLITSVLPTVPPSAYMLFGAAAEVLEDLILLFFERSQNKREHKTQLPFSSCCWGRLILSEFNMDSSSHVTSVTLASFLFNVFRKQNTPGQR